MDIYCLNELMNYHTIPSASAARSLIWVLCVCHSLHSNITAPNGCLAIGHDMSTMVLVAIDVYVRHIIRSVIISLQGKERNDVFNKTHTHSHTNQMYPTVKHCLKSFLQCSRGDV